MSEDGKNEPLYSHVVKYEVSTTEGDENASTTWADIPLSSLKALYGIKNKIRTRDMEMKISYGRTLRKDVDIERVVEIFQKTVGETPSYERLCQILCELDIGEVVQLQTTGVANTVEHAPLVAVYNCLFVLNGETVFTCGHVPPWIRVNSVYRCVVCTQAHTTMSTAPTFEEFTESEFDPFSSAPQTVAETNTLTSAWREKLAVVLQRHVDGTCTCCKAESVT